MVMTVLRAALFCLLTLCIVIPCAQEDDSVRQVSQDSAAGISSQQPQDTISNKTGEPAPSGENTIEKIPIVRRKYDFRRQIRVALGMMAFFVVMLTTAQSWNPD
jgi:hypothetical protein